ncbi:MAG: LysR family transcriptional regulator [Gammaproteobacteria bacterium]|nr:LysR family transcriptional regulator [Gammaproteobacteria bacterium]
MNNHHLLGAMQVFISVVDSGSFSESARRLNISQPSVSRQINALEEYLGVRLLQRSTRRLSLTEAGQIYYEKAREIQLNVIDAEQSISGFKEAPSGLLKISAPYVLTLTKIMPHMGEFLTQYPEIKLDIECNDNIQDMIEEQLDLVIRVGEPTDSSFIAVPFGYVRMVLCASKNYIDQHGIPKTLADLQNHPFIIYEGCSQLVITDTTGTTQQISISGPVTSNSVSVMLSALQQNIGLSVLPDFLINHLLESGELIDALPGADIQIKDFRINQVYALYSNRKHLPAKVRAFLDFFRPRFQ